MEELKFTEEGGSHFIGDIRVYALSTCAFCKKALNFLRDKSITFQYVYVDDLGRSIKKDLKKALKEKYGRDVGFPFLILDEKIVIVGFRENEYETELLERINGRKK